MRKLKNLKKNLDERIEEFIDESEIDDLLENIRDEASDFFKNYFKSSKSIKKEAKGTQSVQIYGFISLVRPAYVFAERIDNLLKIIFGISIIISSLVASLWGFTRLSQLIEFLITSVFGRISLVIIGFSYLLIAVWKLIHLKEGK